MNKTNSWYFKKLNKKIIATLSTPRIRLFVQVLFLIIVFYTGWRFLVFVNHLPYKESWVQRPPGVEAFLPISSIISLKYWILTGNINTIHPAGLAIFIAIVLMGLLLKRSFCSWVCPIGLLSEYLWKFGRKLFGRNLVLPRWLDYPLRSVKYLLLLFFLWAILITMDSTTLREFIYSPYNKVADIKMFLFFKQISVLTLAVILGLILFSIPIKNFWCRYFCPYGALLGFLSFLSPLKITRNSITCTDCKLCTESCPSNITVHKLTRVKTDECNTCLTCVSVCPEENTLELMLPDKKRSVSAWFYAIIVVLIFVIITGLARITGHWKNNISNEEYKNRLKEINQPIYNHIGQTEKTATPVK